MHATLNVGTLVTMPLLLSKFCFDCQYNLVQVWSLQAQQQFQLQVSGHFSMDILPFYYKLQVVLLPEPLHIRI